MSSFKDLYTNLKECCKKLEEEVSYDILKINKIVTQSPETIDNSFVLEKAKDFHYKEIVKHLREIKNQIGLISYHDQKIKNFNSTKCLNQDDVKIYSYVQRQVSKFTPKDDDVIVHHRVDKKFRPTSELSIKSLDVWEKFLLQDQNSTSEMTKSLTKDVHRRNKENSARKVKKFISSTFNGFLENGSNSNSFVSIEENSDEDEDDEGGTRHSSECSYKTADDLDIEEDQNIGNDFLDLINSVEEEEYKRNTNKMDYSVTGILKSLENLSDESLEPALMVHSEENLATSTKILRPLEKIEDRTNNVERNVLAKTEEDDAFTKPVIIDVILKKTD